MTDLKDRRREGVPGVPEHAPGLIDELHRLGDRAREAGDRVAAEGHIREALAIGKHLHARIPGSVAYAQGLATSYRLAGDLAAASGDLVGAREYYQEMFIIRVRLHRADVDAPGPARDLAVACGEIAQLLERGNPEEARTWWHRAWDVLSEMKRRGAGFTPSDGRDLADLEDRFGFGR